METHFECIPCIVNSYLRLAETASKEFKDHFINADVVISKGQGNLEGLMNVPHDHLYFLLVTKCDLIAEGIGTQKGNFVVKRGHLL